MVARKPLTGTVAQNVLDYGTGALNIDGCRVEAKDSQLAEKYASVQNAGARTNAVYGTDNRDRGGAQPHAAGRWPTNVVLDGDAAAAMDEMSGVLAPGNHPAKRSGRGQGVYEMGHTGTEGERRPTEAGGASRFFPVFKYQAKAPKKERPSYIKDDGTNVQHPTVKPVSLIRWLVKLVTPPGGIVLDPFAGSGTTGEAAYLEGFNAILIEREDDYLPLIEARMNKHDEAVEVGA